MKKIIPEENSSIVLIRLLSVFLFVSLSTIAFSQVESQDSLQRGFADYLFNLKQYEFAAEEYERLLFKNDQDIGLLKKLIHSYRLSGKAEYLKTRMDKFEFNNPEILSAYFKLLLTEGYNQEAASLIQKKQSSLSEPIYSEWSYYLALSEKDWPRAKQLYNQELYPAYGPLMKQVNKARYKKPGVAAVMSAIIPGAGRVYAKDAKDGIISFIFVMSTGYQSYRRFDKKGIESVGGWIYGAIALGFHISNIYGSWQSAKYYNNKIDTKLHESSLYHINADLE